MSYKFTVKSLKEIEKNNGKTSLKFRELMASKAFALTAYYDSIIANYFNKISKKYDELYKLNDSEIPTDFISGWMFKLGVNFFPITM